jgi:hypothetical protein
MKNLKTDDLEMALGYMVIAYPTIVMGTFMELNWPLKTAWGRGSNLGAAMICAL